MLRYDEHSYDYDMNDEKSWTRYDMPEYVDTVV